MKVLTLVLCAAAAVMAQAVPKLPLVAVMPLTAQGVDEASALVVTDALSDELMRDGKVRVMERSQMEKLLKEQGFQQSGVCEGTDCALVMGKLLAIDRMVVGSLGKLGESYTLSVRSVDVATGEVLGSARRMRKGAIDDVIADLLPLVTKDLAFQKAPKSSLAVAGTTTSSSESRVSQRPSDSSHAWIWWTAGAAAVTGGVVAAVLLTGQSSSSSPSPTPADVVSLDAKWK